MSKIFATALLILCYGTAHGSILPPNNLDQQDNLYSLDANIDEPRFNAIIDEVIESYRTIVESYGIELTVNKLWTNSTVNASAEQRSDTWIVNMYGGLARRPEVTPDGFSLVVCHEIGHHLAGYPLKGDTWAANEGQADYFATQSCAHKIWGNQLEENAKYRDLVEPLAKQKCDEIWNNEAAQNLCYRTATAGLSLATLLSVTLGQPVPKFETPDLTEVAKTNNNHPKGQCRLDTYLQGALCTIRFDETNIPGKKHEKGQNSAAAEWEASKVSCTSAALFDLGVRPRCWFKPKVDLLVDSGPGAWTAISGDGDDMIEPGESWTLFPKIKNDSQRDFSNVNVKVVSSNPDLTVTGDEIIVNNARAGEEKITDGSVLVAVGEQAECGEMISYKISASVNGKENITSHLLDLGRRVDSQTFEQNPEVSLPEYQTVSNEISIPDSTPLKRLNVSLNIETIYSQTYSVSIESPSGESHIIQDRKTTDGGWIRGTFAFPSKDTDAKGVWKLVVKNHGEFRGKLHNWSIKFSDYICDTSN
ncbi:MAG: proprotein convertase P-domain-containing protein [Oligoflexales bacterium]